jgi:hypothetical protein
MIEPLTLTVAELAARWNKPSRLVLEFGLPMYFYFDGLVFEFSDKWHRANGDVQEVQDLEAHKARLSTLEIDLERQSLHKRGLLKLTQWEEALSDDELHNYRAEADRVGKQIAHLTALLKERSDERQHCVRNGLLRAAPRTVHEIAQHGQTKFPHFAYMPHSPGSEGKSLIPDGAVVALEDGFPLKEWLTEADIVVSMLDVKVAEAATR